MERFVRDYRWQSGLSWTIAIAMFVAVVVFGAPPVTVAGVILGELMLVAYLIRRYPFDEDPRGR
ncbi:MAG: hypothetical protein JST31_06800 [Actinobacteria bacterium]|nr:hypothetical protein [Actinomycetota bacterium]